MNLFQIMAIDCSTPLVNAIITGTKVVFSLIQWGIPLVLIILCTIDMFKAMASGDEKKTKEVQSVSIRRLIYAVVAFLIPFIIDLVFGFIGNVVADDSAETALSTWQNFFACWKGNTSYSGSSTTNTNNNNNNSSGDGSGTLNCDPSMYTGTCYDNNNKPTSLNYCQCMFEFASDNYYWQD